MGILIYIITKTKDNIKSNIHEQGYFKGLIKSFKLTLGGILIILFMIFFVFMVVLSVFSIMRKIIECVLPYNHTNMGDTQVTIGVIITEIGVYLFSGIHLLKHKSKQRFIVCFCAIVLTLGGFFIGLDGMNKYCYFDRVRYNGVLAAKHGLLSKEILYRAYDINFVRISNEITYGEKSNGKSTVRTGPYQDLEFKIYLKDGTCLEMEELKCCDYLYKYLTKNNVPIVYEEKGAKSLY